MISLASPGDFDATLAAWQPFFAGQLAAGATFLGLIFVGLSLNLARILAEPTLPRRAEIGLLLLALQLVTASIALVPDQGPVATGIEMLAVAVAIWLWTSVTALRIVAGSPGRLRRIACQNALLLQAALLPYLVGGAMLLAGTGPALHVVALGLILSFLKAGLDAWVLLIEINR